MDKEDKNKLVFQFRLQSNLETDKAYLYISSAAVGVLSNFLLTSGNIAGPSFALLTLSLALFILSIMLIIRIFIINTEYCDAMIQGLNNVDDLNRKLNTLDIIVSVFFALAFITLLLNFILLGCKYLN